MIDPSARHTFVFGTVPAASRGVLTKRPRTQFRDDVRITNPTTALTSTFGLIGLGAGLVISGGGFIGCLVLFVGLMKLPGTVKSFGLLSDLEKWLSSRADLQPRPPPSSALIEGYERESHDPVTGITTSQRWIRKCG